MVDFQSRDTRRGLEDEEEETEAEESEPGDETGEKTEESGEVTGEPEEDPGTGDQSAGATEAADRPANESGDGKSTATDVPDGDSTHEETAERDDESRGRGSDEGRDGRGDGNDRSDEHHDDHGHSDEHHDDHDGHDHHAHDLDTLGVAVVTVSSSRTLSDDPAGDTITEVMEADDDEVVTRELIPDDYDRIQGTLDNLVTRGDVDAIVTTGGTGVTPDDVTIEAARRLFDKELPGFGELFRLLSYDEIGTKVVGTRATAGIVNGVPVFCLPGSENAARLGAETIISEEAGHIAGLAKRADIS
jgi:molybdenum cofactor biosynthesis protein B